MEKLLGSSREAVVKQLGNGKEAVGNETLLCLNCFT